MIALGLFILGTIMGSFYLVIGKRLPLKEDVVKSRSHCDLCKHDLRWYDLIPVFSYIFLMGKCRYCHKKIDLLNIIVEIVTGALFAFSYLYYGHSYNMYIMLIICSLLILIYITDFKYYIILDSPLVIGAILISILRLIYFGYENMFIHLGLGIVLFVTMFIIKLIGDKIFKRESLGGGDIKFAGIIGLVLGYRLGLICLILSAFLALPYSFTALMLKKNNEVPYGPFLVSSLFLVFVFLSKFESLLELIF